MQNPSSEIGIGAIEVALILALVVIIAIPSVQLLGDATGQNLCDAGSFDNSAFVQFNRSAGCVTQSMPFVPPDPNGGQGTWPPDEEEP